MNMYPLLYNFSVASKSGTKLGMGHVYSDIASLFRGKLLLTKKKVFLSDEEWDSMLSQ